MVGNSHTSVWRHILHRDTESTRGITVAYQWNLSYLDAYAEKGYDSNKSARWTREYVTMGYTPALARLARLARPISDAGEVVEAG